MSTVLVTGANRGLGLEFARQYAADGWRVIATCRNPKSAKALREIEGDVKVRPLNVTDWAQVKATARALKATPIDLLINNAGVYGPRKEVLGKIDVNAWDEVFHVNVMAPLLLSEVLVEQVAKSEKKTIVTITSGMGSITLNASGGAYMYRSSKAAVNMVMKGLSITLKPRGIIVALIHPGWVRTDMGGAGADSAPEESVIAMRKVIAGLKPKHSGSFLKYDGTEFPW
jgi:NAD(P)-dependent dehydrogenase (short-subunit alcohol dehydrogenase family)